jgi:ArsR family transcriptional regulator
VTTRPDDLMFRAFADERRLRILHLLRRRETCVADLVEILGLPQSTVSRQLGILREAGLVSFREDGLWRHYALTVPAGALHEHLVDCLGRCFAHVPELREDASRAEALHAAGGCCPGVDHAPGVAAPTCPADAEDAGPSERNQRLRK